MKDWKQQRNYRRVRDEHGNVIANIITVDGIDVEVTEEVYKAYSTMERRERYQEEAKADAGFLSLGQMAEGEVKWEYLCSDAIESSEDSFFGLLEQHEWHRRLDILPNALDSLNTDDRNLITQIYFEKHELKGIACQLGISYQAVQQRRAKILAVLKEFLENF